MLLCELEGNRQLPLLAGNTLWGSTPFAVTRKLPGEKPNNRLRAAPSLNPELTVCARNGHWQIANNMAALGRLTVVSRSHPGPAHTRRERITSNMKCRKEL